MNSTEIIIWIIVIFIITFFSIHIGLYGKFWKKAKEIKEDKSLDTNSRYLLSLALALIVIGFVAPFIFTGKNSTLDFIGSGEIGDTIGGIMNPFISVAAVIVTGLAFYAQYRANEMVRKQFELQKFENQFYEMLRLHKENVNEIQIKTADGKDVIKGREVFFEMNIELEILIQLFEKHNELDEKGFEYLYYKFFFGHRKQAKDLVLKVINNDNDQTYSEFNKEIEEYSNGEPLSILLKDNYENTLLKDNLSPKIKKLDGLYIYLGHYYRHLFHIVKFVVYQDEKIISEKQKLDYLRILRAQLSNYEQTMLFYNWISNYGKTWENETNRFFTKYKMIHNMWYSELYKNSFIENKIGELKNKYRELTGKENLFEIDENKQSSI